MACDQHQERILDYEQLTAGEQQSVDAHLRVCPQCREVAREWRALDSALSTQLRAPELSRHFDAQLRQRIASETAILTETSLAEQRRALEAEYTAAHRRQNLGWWIPRLLDVLGSGVAGGLGGWFLLMLMAQANTVWTASLTLTGPQMLVISSATGLVIALGLVAFAFRRPLRQVASR
jgi:anti-sigma factor RsiW